MYQAFQRKYDGTRHAPRPLELTVWFQTMNTLDTSHTPGKLDNKPRENETVIQTYTEFMFSSPSSYSTSRGYKKKSTNETKIVVLSSSANTLLRIHSTLQFGHVAVGIDCTQEDGLKLIPVKKSDFF
jgi:hypothetical protein